MVVDVVDPLQIGRGGKPNRNASGSHKTSDITCTKPIRVDSPGFATVS